jgi:hypothetical protein
MQEAREQEPRAQVIKDAIQAALPAGVKVFEVDEVPGTEGGPSGTTPTRYVTFDLSRRWHPERRGDADMIPGWALVTHYRAPNVTDGRKLRDCVTEALEGRAYDLPNGDTIGPFDPDFDDGFSHVDGGWSAFDGWTA